MLSHIRTNIFDNFKYCNLDELISKKLNNEKKEFKCCVIDFNYECKEKNNKNILRIQGAYIFEILSNMNLLMESETKEFFFAITFKIIPKNFRPYKLLVIPGIRIKYNNPI